MLLNITKLFFIIIAISSTSLNAATLQTWRLTATALNTDDPAYIPVTSPAPAFAAPGKTFTVDYVIDLDTPFVFSDYNGAIKQIKFNGETSKYDGGYILAVNGLQALNAFSSARVNDNIQFSSFNYFNFGLEPTIALILSDIQQNLDQTQFRFDYGNPNSLQDSLYAKPISFNQVVSPVPLPASGLLMLSALAGFGFFRKKTHLSL